MNKGANPMTLSIKVNEFAYVLHECVNGWAIFEKKWECDNQSRQDGSHRIYDCYRWACFSFKRQLVKCVFQTFGLRLTNGQRDTTGVVKIL